MQKAQDIDQLTTDYIQHLGGMHPSVCLVPLKIMSRGSHETQLDTELSAPVGRLSATLKDQGADAAPKAVRGEQNRPTTKVIEDRTDDSSASMQDLNLVPSVSQSWSY